MKKELLFALVCLGLGACQRISVSEIEAEQAQTQRKDVQFVIAGITEEYSTRATIASVGCTDLWVWEGETLLKHQTSSDEDFGIPTVSLTYGAHDLTFVASAADGQTVSEGVWACSKVKDTFGKVMQVTVSGGSSTSRQVQLVRRSAKVAFTIQDAIPAEVKTIHLKVGSHLGLDAALAGVNAADYEATVDVSSKAGKTGFAPTVNVMTASDTEAEDVAALIEFLGADGSVLYHYERTISVKANRCTNLTGNYFAGDANAVSVLADWEDELQVEL